MGMTTYIETHREKVFVNGVPVMEIPFCQSTSSILGRLARARNYQEYFDVLITLVGPLQKYTT